MGVSWLKQGKDSAALATKAKAEAEARAAAAGSMFRFFMNKGEDCRLTFVDGDLSDQGFLLPPRFYEHTIFHGNKWTNFVCPEKTNPESGEKCPLCEANDYASLVALFTVIDHRTYKSEATGKVYKDTTKLFVAKSGTFEMLNKIAIKRDGLAGCQFDVSRTGDKAPAVGSMFDFVDKTPVAELKGKWVHTVKDAKGKESQVDAFQVADYEKEVVWRTGDELRALGLGKPGSGMSQQTTQQATKEEAKPENYENHL